MNRKWKKALAVAMSLVMAMGLANAAQPAKQAEAAKKKTYVVVLDPGHDETHTGAKYNGLDEAEITLKLAKYVKAALLEDYDNVKVYLTRTDEECAFGGKSIATADCLKARAKYAKKKKATVFVSLHVNSSTGTVAKGVESYSATAFMNKKVGKTSHTLAQNIQAKLVKLGFTNRGTKYANWTVIKTANEYSIPAVLIEHGFIRNPSDRRWLSSAAKLKKMAQADADGIGQSLGLKKTDDVDDDDEDYDDDDYDDDDDDDDFDSVKVTKTKTTAKVTTKAVKTNGKATVTGTVKLGSITAADFAGLRITWNAFPNAKGYAIYRRATDDDEYDDAFRKVATVKTLSYTDNAVEPATTYQYTVRAYGKGFKTGDTKKFLTKKTRSAAVEEFQAARGTFNVVNLSWKQKSLANGYRIERAKVDEDGDTGSYKKLVTFTKPTVLAYKDTTTEAGVTYKYRIHAYHKYGAGKQWGVFKGVKITAGSNKVKSLTLTKQGSTQVQLKWASVSLANGYEVSRAKNSGSFSVLATVDNGDRTYTDDTVDASNSYKYRVRAFYVENEKTYWGEYSDTVTLSGSSSSSSSDASFLIAGKPQTTTSQMKAYYNARGVSYPKKVYADKGAATIDEFVKIVYEEATDEGIRPEVVFGQICRETRFLQFGGQVKAKQCNFAGLGVTGDDTSGESFGNVRKGVRAQVQHLKAYANTESLVHSKVDPRFDFVKRGSAKYVEWLGIKENPNGSGWASEKDYGYSLIENFIDVLLGS